MKFFLASFLFFITLSQTMAKEIPLEFVKSDAVVKTPRGPFKALCYFSSSLLSPVILPNDTSLDTDDFDGQESLHITVVCNALEVFHVSLIEDEEGLKHTSFHDEFEFQEGEDFFEFSVKLAEKQMINKKVMPIHITQKLRIDLNEEGNIKSLEVTNTSTSPWTNRSYTLVYEFSPNPAGAGPEEEEEKEEGEQEEMGPLPLSIHHLK